MDERNFTSAPSATTSTNSTDTSELSKFDYITETVANLLYVYYTPVLIVLGSLGNLVSVLVFWMSKLRLQSTSLYLSALALSDTVFLLLLIPPWMKAVKFNSVFHKAGFCQVFVYTSYVTCFLSAWLVVAFTIERFVAVVYPLRRNSMCTVTRAKHIIILLVAAGLTLNIPVIKYASPTGNDCNIDFDYLEHAARFNIVDTALSFTVPLGVIILLNTWITVGVYQLEGTRRALVKVEGAAAASGRMRAAAQVPERPPMPRSQSRVTRMLLLVSSVFVVLNVPAYTMRLLAYAYDMSGGEYSGRWAAVQQLSLMFFNTNFGINFILYCLSGQNFRRALCQTFPCLRRFARNDDAVRRISFHTARASSVSTSFVSASEAAHALVHVHGHGHGHGHGNGHGHGSGQGHGNGHGHGHGHGSVLVHGQVGPMMLAEGSMRRHRSAPFIQRWTFNNNRELRALPAPPAAGAPASHDIELEELALGHHM